MQFSIRRKKDPAIVEAQVKARIQAEKDAWPYIPEKPNLTKLIARKAAKAGYNALTKFPYASTGRVFRAMLGYTVMGLINFGVRPSLFIGQSLINGFSNLSLNAQKAIVVPTLLAGTVWMSLNSMEDTPSKNVSAPEIVPTPAENAPTQATVTTFAAHISTNTPNIVAQFGSFSSLDGAERLMDKLNENPKIHATLALKKELMKQQTDSKLSPPIT